MLGEVLLAGVRLSHALAAALWLGGTLVFALSPVGGWASGPARSATTAFREALRLGIGVFVLSGVVLSVERLASAPLPPTYFAILLLKIGLGIWMFASARHIGAMSALADTATWARPEYRVLALGVIIYALAIALRTIYESAIRG